MRWIAAPGLTVTTVIVLTAAGVEPRGTEALATVAVPPLPMQGLPGGAEVRSDRSGYIVVGWYTFGTSGLQSISIYGKETRGSDDGLYHRSEIEVSEGVSEWGPVGRYGYRSVKCTVPRNALQFAPERYRILPTVLDAASSSCTTTGQLTQWDSNGTSTSPWVFEGEIPVEALLASPEGAFRQTGTETHEDNVRGVTSHWMCTKHSGFAFREGGFRVGDSAYGLLVVPDGAPWSNAGDSNCKAIDR